MKLYVLPDSLIYYDMIFSRILSFLTPGIYLLLYLTHRRRGGVIKKTDWRLIPVGVAYSLSSYAIAYFVYSGFGFLSILPMILLGMERLIYDKKPFLYIFFLFSFMGDAYYAFMLCEFIFLYFFTMEFTGIKDMFFKGIRILIASVAAAGLACYRLIPYFFRTLSSPYKANDAVSPVSKANGSYLSVFSETMGFRQPSIVTNNDYEANLYLGILILLCIPLYLMNRRVPLSVRIRRILLVILFFFGFGNSTLNYLFHGFHYQSMVPNRFAAFYVFLLVVMFYDCLLNWQGYGGKLFAFSISGTVGVCALMWIVAHVTGADLKNDEVSAAGADYCFVISLLISALYLIFALLQLQKRNRMAFRNGMVAVLLAEVLISSFCSFQYAIGGDAIVFSRGDDWIDSLSARNPKMHTDFYASEYVAGPSFNSAEAADYTSVSAFSSTMSENHMRLVRKWSIINSSNILYYSQGNALADMMLHIQYHITNDAVDGSISPYPQVDKEGMLRLHENPWYLPVGVFFPLTDELEMWNQKDFTGYDNNVLKYHNAFSHALSCGDIYHPIELEVDDSRTENYSNLNLVHFENNGSTEEITAYIHIAEDVEGEMYMFHLNEVNYLGSKSKGEDYLFKTQIYLSEEYEDAGIWIAVFDKDEMQRVYEKLAQHTMSDASINGSSFSGTIIAPEDGMVYLSVPNMTEWVFNVDGNDVEAKDFLGGAGLAVTTGQHTITAKFVPQGMWLGIWISLAVLVLTILFAVQRKKNSFKNENRVDDKQST